MPELEPQPSRRPGGWTAFFILLTFLLGNGVSFVVFGLRNATKDDVDRAIKPLIEDQAAIHESIAAIEKHEADRDESDAYLKGQLQAHKLISP